MAERCLKHLSAYNVKIMSGLPCNLKDEGSFHKNLWLDVCLPLKRSG
ncbi:hypothetical protein HMPREF9442_00135 [Paraprevotella xylaniphila YIT 11841]|uniref:Uncharacterized protein n=1 Tax=Paraprevotella xylaniphila YIT 11841 TaxID=762982 RepID=F3QPP8_9BACT|nr:hypothetical protein HMPREF9442_00135 [Paraprevotella xylaniphila YIT 11841]